MRVRCLVSLLLVALASGIPQRAAAQDRYGTTVVSVDIEGAPATVLEDFPIAPGSTLSRDAVHSAIQTLYDRGGYGRIEVEARESAAGGTDLIFYVEDPYFFATIRIEPRGLLERPLSSYLPLPYGERFSPGRLGEIAAEVGDLLEAEGYFGSDVTYSYTRDVSTRLVTSLIRVQAGLPARIGDVRFEGGEQTFSREELEDAFDVGPGERFRGNDIREAEDRLRALFVGLEGRAGFLQTGVTTVSTWNPAENTVDLVVTIQPGNYTFVDLRGFDISDERLRELVPVFEESSYDDDLIEEGRLDLLEYLRREGYFEASVVTPDTIEVPLDPTFPDGEQAVQIIYDVEAGQRYVVAAVDVIGNEYFSGKVIHDAIELRSRGVFSRGVFSPELMSQAEETIRGMYAGAGFRGTVVEASRSIERNEIRVRIDIEEGEQLMISRVEITGNAALGDEEIARTGNMFGDAIYRPVELDAARRAIITRYHSLGYADVQVRTTASPGEDGVVVGYDVVEGDRYQVGRIVIAGQTLTRRSVIERYVNREIQESAPYDPEAVLETQRTLYATGLFNRVDVVTLEQDRGGERDVFVHVEDASPLLLTYGVGVQQGLDLQSTGTLGGSRGDVDVRGTVEISHNNVWGLDRTISARLRGSRQEQSFQTTYREPQLFNWDLDGFASFRIERIQAPQFSATEIDFALQTLYEFPNQDNLLLTASFETVNLRDIRVSQRPTDEIGTIQVATLGGSWVRDGRNDRFNPSRGNYFSGTFRVGYHGWGSEVDFTSLFLQASIFRPANEAVIAGSVRFGWNHPFGEARDRDTGIIVAQDLPITERYFAGGSTTLRAFGIDEAGPPGGGNALFLLNLEYRYPVPVFSNLSGAVFYDTGTVFRELSDFTVGDFTHTAGFGLRYLTPAGPVRFDFGINLNRKLSATPGIPDEPASKFHFTLGHAF